MPKSYLSDEPGAQRAERNWFDPYLQTYRRLLAYRVNGHDTDKVEIIVLGGTWSYYPESYQIWFIAQCFQALNDFGAGIDHTMTIEAHYAQVNAQLQTQGFQPRTNDPESSKQRTELFALHGEKLSTHSTYNIVVSDIYTKPEKLLGLDTYQSTSWETLEALQHINESAGCRCVGLVLETRPDNISPQEVIRMRRLGATKTQIGVQSLQDHVLLLNHRGHDVAATRRAFQLLRQAGMKIHAHWMPNLLGSTPQHDKEDFVRLFSDPDFCPDELKIYPCSLIESAELMQYYQRGEWQPYTQEELLDVLLFCLEHTPQYCRLTRIIRDIPSTDIVVGNKMTNLRQVAEHELARTEKFSWNIRAREVRDRTIDVSCIQFRAKTYETTTAREVFLECYLEHATPTDQPEPLVGFCRVSLPHAPSYLDELHDSAIIRELHVYGQVAQLGKQHAESPQHLGLGAQLLERARVIAREARFSRIAVISAIGTREYYRKRGFTDGTLYQHATVS
jgi:elongator complex protein 3